jgi:hypothetical protein
VAVLRAMEDTCEDEIDFEECVSRSKVGEGIESLFLLGSSPPPALS